MKSNLNNPVYSKNVIEFVTVATEYCKFVENVTNHDRAEFIQISQKLLPLLYLKASMLPEINKQYDEDCEHFVNEDDYNFVHEQIVHKLGKFEQYIEISLSISDTETETESAGISECYTDIYQDLKNFTTNYELGNEETMNDALWECKTNYGIFWGQRLLALLNALHNLVFGNNDLSEENENNDIQDNENTRNVDNWIISQRFKDFQQN